jgi:hypothetical protein
MYKTSLGSVTAEIEDLLADKLSAKGRNLNQKVKHAGRKLSPKFRKQVAYLIEVETRYQNPKHAHQYDPARVLAARKQCVTYLEKIDRRAVRNHRRLAWITTVAVNLFVIAVLFTIGVHYLT